jgi:Ca2+-binding EF-hand superfamily protein
MEEQLTNKFRFYDRQDSGFVEQTDFKTVLSELGVSLSLPELVKLVRFVPINAKNHLDYNYVVDKLTSTELESRSELTESEFRRVMR